MTFGEKLYQLRKSKGLSQEALAEQLNTSRQAVSKWENNNGYPETEKLILISKLFEIELDTLLLDERGVQSDKNATTISENQCYYVNRETVNGFLLYYKRKFLLLALAFGVIIGCNSASYSTSEHSFYDIFVAPILTTTSLMVALAIVFYIFLKQNPYRTLRKKELELASDVSAEITEEFSKIKGILIIGITLGSLAFFAANFFSGDIFLILTKNMDYITIMSRIVVSMTISGISSFIIFFCTGIFWSYSTLLRNNSR